MKMILGAALAAAVMMIASPASAQTAPNDARTDTYVVVGTPQSQVPQAGASTTATPDRPSAIDPGNPEISAHEAAVAPARPTTYQAAATTTPTPTQTTATKPKRHIYWWLIALVAGGVAIAAAH